MSFRPQGENLSERTPVVCHAQKFSLSCLVRNDTDAIWVFMDVLQKTFFLLRHAPRSLRLANHMGIYGCKPTRHAVR